MQTNDVETAGQIAALESLVPNLAKLEGLLAGGTSVRLQALRNFGVDNPDSLRLEELLAEAKARPAEFNLFETLNPWWQEDVHSRVLTWLLNPNGDHGVGGYFLKGFLLRAGCQADVCDAADWSNAKSEREWRCVVDGREGWLDILVVNNAAGFLCAIENKVFSPEGGRQLTHYRRALEEAYSDFTRCYVFLSPSGMESQWEDEREHWMPMNYTTILQLVEKTIDDNAATISEDVHVFLRQYATTLRRSIVPESSEIQQLARKIYLEHREAVELIYRHKPSYVAETTQRLMEAVRQQGWQIDLHYSPYFRFRPRDWDKFSSLQTGKAFSGSKAMLRFEFEIGIGFANLSLDVWPGDDEAIRRSITESVNQHPNVFNEAPVDFQIGIMVLYTKEYHLDGSDLDNWDDPSVRAKITAWVDTFAQNEFPAMNAVILNCLREYEAEQAQ